MRPMVENILMIVKNYMSDVGRVLSRIVKQYLIGVWTWRWRNPVVMRSQDIRAPRGCCRIPNRGGSGKPAGLHADPSVPDHPRMGRRDLRRLAFDMKRMEPPSLDRGSESRFQSLPILRDPISCRLIGKPADIIESPGRRGIRPGRRGSGDDGNRWKWAVTTRAATRFRWRRRLERRR